MIDWEQVKEGRGGGRFQTGRTVSSREGSFQSDGQTIT